MTAPCCAISSVETAKASRYLQALCGHFQRKVAAEWTAQEGRVDFGFARCRMTVDGETLIMRVEAETAEGCARAKAIVGGHLERFAVKDGLQATWIDAPGRPGAEGGASPA